MIISRTPFRISFLGGGTDYPQWSDEHGGAVLAATINRYCYISCRRLPPFFDHKYRIIYSKVENTKSIDEIQHPSVRAVLNYFNCQEGLEIHHDADLPARSGLGSSSSFTVGLINALKVTPIILPNERLKYFQPHLMLFFTGFSRLAPEIAKSKIEKFEKKYQEL